MKPEAHPRWGIEEYDAIGRAWRVLSSYPTRQRAEEVSEAWEWSYWWSGRFPARWQRHYRLLAL